MEGKDIVTENEEMLNQDLEEMSLEEQEIIEQQTTEQQSISKNKNEDQKGITINIKNRNRFISVILVVVVVIVGAIVVNSVVNKKKPPSITSTSDLERILKISQLSSYQFAYNGIAEIKKEDEPAYYVSYESNVKASVDLDKVTFKRDDDKKILYVTIPYARINKPDIDVKKSDSIFKDKDEDDRYSFIDSLPVCEDDAKTETKKNEKHIIKAANENARGIIKGLFDPLAQQEDYVVRVKSRRLK